jgi:fructuronate reductase
MRRLGLWLLNGAHSLLAYAGSVRGHATVAEAVGDEMCRSWLEDWWAVASRHLGQSDEEIAAYRSALLERFANTRMHDRLDRIAADGSQKPADPDPSGPARRASGRSHAAWRHPRAGSVGLSPAWPRRSDLRCAE